MPGMLVSILWHRSRPPRELHWPSGRDKRETPSPLRPDQPLVETLIYPKQLCGVQVMFGDTPSGLLYVQGGQINFKCRRRRPMEGAAPLRVVYQGRSSAAVDIRLGLEAARCRWNSRRMSADQSGFTSKPAVPRGSAMCNIPWEFTRRTSAVTRWKYGATARCSGEFRFGPPVVWSTGCVRQHRHSRPRDAA